jgi:polygalacturonase
MLDVRDFGAVGDGETVNTQSIQAAIDRCSADGHDGVIVQGGRYVTGTLRLKSGVRLHVAAGAALLGSVDIQDYDTGTHKNMYRGEPHMDRCLIYAEDAEFIAIDGAGVIDGQGHRSNFPNTDDPARNRPMLLRFLNCSHVRVRDVRLQNPAAWTSAWLYCSDIVVDGISIHSRANVNGDGLDFDGCQGVRVSNSEFDTSDDSICLQTSKPDVPCRDVTITNCIFVSRWAGIRIGLLSRGDFENVIVSGCVFRSIRDAGLKIQMCEGGTMRNMLFTDLVMTDVPRPVFMTLCRQRACVDAPPGLAPIGAIERCVFKDMVIDSSMCGEDSAIIAVGMPGKPLRDLTFRDIRFVSGGGGTRGSTATLPDLTPERLEGGWPEYHSFDTTVPSYGIYVGHVAGLTIDSCAFDTSEKDDRPTIICDDADRCRISDNTTGWWEAEVVLNGETLRSPRRGSDDHP